MNFLLPLLYKYNNIFILLYSIIGCNHANTCPSYISACRIMYHLSKYAYRNHKINNQNYGYPHEIRHTQLRPDTLLTNISQAEINNILQNLVILSLGHTNRHKCQRNQHEEQYRLHWLLTYLHFFTNNFISIFFLWNIRIIVYVI